MLQNFIKKIVQIRNLFGTIAKKLDNQNGLQINAFISKNLFENPKYLNNKRLNIHEYQVFSQNGEDGIIQEIFDRIGVTNKYFIEFGVENGLECNSTYLLYKGWKGYWIEGSAVQCKQIGTRFADLIQNKSLIIENAFIDAENIEALFDKANAPTEPDLLSIDIDYNDYYVWEKITKYRPRVVIIEYNSIFRPDTHFVVRYNAKRMWDKTSHFGASLLAFQQLGNSKGYCLVGCVFTGTNAFFVRQDLVADFFEAPFTAQNHYEPNRDFLYYKAGHQRGRIAD